MNPRKATKTEASTKMDKLTDMEYDERVPIVPGTLIPYVHRDGRVEIFEVKVSCPFCGKRHTHGGGEDGSVGTGYRLSHCQDSALQNTYSIFVPDNELVAAHELYVTREAASAEAKRKRTERQQLLLVDSKLS